MARPAKVEVSRSGRTPTGAKPEQRDRTTHDNRLSGDAEGEDLRSHRGHRDHRHGLRRPAAGPHLLRKGLPGSRFRRRSVEDRRPSARRELHQASRRRAAEGGPRVGTAGGDGGLRSALRARRHPHLRPHAAHAPARAGHELCRGDGEADRPSPSRRPARRPRVEHVPRDDGRARARTPRGLGPEERPRLLPGLLSRARRPGQSLVLDRDHSEGRRRRRSGVRETWRRRCTTR